jgi:hypothetical protein
MQRLLRVAGQVHNPDVLAQLTTERDAAVAEAARLRAALAAVHVRRSSAPWPPATVGSNVPLESAASVDVAADGAQPRVSVDALAALGSQLLSKAGMATAAAEEMGSDIAFAEAWRQSTHGVVQLINALEVWIPAGFRADAVPTVIAERDATVPPAPYHSRPRPFSRQLMTSHIEPPAAGPTPCGDPAARGAVAGRVISDWHPSEGTSKNRIEIPMIHRVYLFSALSSLG